MSTPDLPPPPPPTGVPVAPGEPPAPPSGSTEPPEPEQPSGWFPDPNGRHEHRYFNGRTWTADVSDGGQRSIDPLGSGPSPAAAYVPARRGNGMATAALVCGIGAVLLGWIPFLVVAGFVLAVLALVFGVQGVRRSNLTGSGRGQAVAGIVLGALGVALSVIGVILSVVAFREVRAFMNPAAHDVEVTSCAVVDGVATAEGTLTNRDDDPARFTVFVELRVGDEHSEHSDRMELLDPGDTATWRVAEFDVVAGEQCDVDEIHVFGPFPFDVPMDRP
jgi:hypothetical protein